MGCYQTADNEDSEPLCLKHQHSVLAGGFEASMSLEGVPGFAVFALTTLFALAPCWLASAPFILVSPALGGRGGDRRTETPQHDTPGPIPVPRSSEQSRWRAHRAVRITDQDFRPNRVVVTLEEGADRGVGQLFVRQPSTVVFERAKWRATMICHSLVNFSDSRTRRSARRGNPRRRVRELLPAQAWPLSLQGRPPRPRPERRRLAQAHRGRDHREGARGGVGFSGPRWVHTIETRPAPALRGRGRVCFSGRAPD